MRDGESNFCRWMLLVYGDSVRGAAGHSWHCLRLYWRDDSRSDLPAIFYHTEQQRELAQQSKEQLTQSGRFDKPIVTEILPASIFYPAEDYHQDYHKKNVKDYKEDRA
ncbi:UNVERIFIED_CONTAM: hypothetical protein ABIC26_002221 [Paenibacillus sp. PvR008]